MKHAFPLALALLGACSSASSYEPDTSVDWSTNPIDSTRADTCHESGPIDLSGELDLGQLIEIVADRNPRLAAARHRWLASAQRPPQARALLTLVVVPVSHCLMHEIKLKRSVAAEAVLSHHDGPNDPE